MSNIKTNIVSFSLAIIIGSSVFFTACLDRIDLDIDNGGVINIAVNARLIYGTPSTLQVSLSEVFDFDGNSRLIVAKSVELISEDGESAKSTRPKNGFYSITFPSAESDVLIDPNKKYMVHILLASDEILESNFQNIKRLSKDNTLEYDIYPEQFENDDGDIVDRIGVNFISETTLPSDSDTKLKWEFRQTFKFTDFNLGNMSYTAGSRKCEDESFDICAALRNDPASDVALLDCDLDGFTNAVECDKSTDPRKRSDQPRFNNREQRSCYLSGFVDVPNVKIFDPANGSIEGPTLRQNLFQPKVDFKFSEGYYVRLITESLNTEAFEYFDKIGTIINLSGSMFDPPAAKVTGNFLNITNPEVDVFGYFYATERDTNGIYISPDLVGNPDTLCLAEFPGPPPNYCLDCKLWQRDLDLEGILPPEFWPTN